RRSSGSSARPVTALSRRMRSLRRSPHPRPRAMRLPSTLLLLLATLPASAIELGAPGGRPIAFKGLLQGDAIHFHEDADDLDGGSDDRATAVRRFELVLEGQAPWNLEWVLGVDAKS